LLSGQVQALGMVKQKAAMAILCNAWTKGCHVVVGDHQALGILFNG